MGIGGDGVNTVAIVWVLSAITLVWCCLRFYTRQIVIKSYGIDDHVYMLAFVLQVVSACFVNVAAHYGIGQTMEQIDDMSSVTNAAFYGIMSQIFSATGVAVAKWSLGLFLLRIVDSKWYRFAIWSILGYLACASLTWIIMFWLQCTPFAYLYDRTIPGGACNVPFMGVSILHATTCVFTDIAFAVLPWFFLGKLRLTRREKLVTLGSMSLGFIAGAFGVIRATKLPALWSDNYLKNGVGIIVWTAAEMTVTMVCIGIPICRPLYKHWMANWWPSRISSQGHDDRFNKRESFMATNTGESMFGVSAGGPAGLVPLHTIGGTLSPVPGMDGPELDHKVVTGESRSSSRVSDNTETRKHGTLSRVYLATAGRVLSRNEHRGNSSDEETLAGDYQLEHATEPRPHRRRYWSRRERRRPSGNEVPPHLGLLMGITVTEEFHVTSNRNDL